MLGDSRLRSTGLRLSLGLSLLVTMSMTPSDRAAADTQPSCAATTEMSAPAAGPVSGSSAVSGPSQPSTGHPCWTDVQPYPFGSEGRPVDTSSVQCAPGPSGEQSPSCYLTVTSMAFRAWNRGLAATEASAQVNGEPAADPFVVWLFNGTRWFPDPTFPGQAACKGNTVVWAGKLDYWLVGPGNQTWPSICRFDGINFLWEPLSLPQKTLQRITVPASDPPRLEPGGITSAACPAWNDCWFFGTYGTVVHWDGKALSDASPDPAEGWLQTEYTGAVARQGQDGKALGLSVGASSERAATSGPLPPQPDGAPPAQLFGWTGAGFSPLGFTPPTVPQPGDPYRTDLVSVDIDAQAQGWVAGDPEGYRAKFEAGPDAPPANGRPVSSSPEPAPLVPVSPAGASTSCTGPSQSRFTYTSNLLASYSEEALPGAFLWSSIAAVPAAGEALAGGRMRPAAAGRGPNEDTIGEPSIAQVSCDGKASVTRFRISDPTWSGPELSPLAPADRGGTVTAIAASTSNDAWAATSKGELRLPGSISPYFEPPHIYRLTDGGPPAAPEGDDVEPRPLELQLDPPILVLEPPPPPPPPPAPMTVVKKHRVRLRSAVYDVRAKVHGRKHLSLYLIFRLRRPVTLGAEALRHRQIVGIARPRRFTGHRGQLVMPLDRKHWPTKVRFITRATKDASGSTTPSAPATVTR
jgi:hypothetical protein